MSVVAEGVVCSQIGKGVVRRGGKDVALVCYGTLTNNALAAAEMLAKSGVTATVADMRWVIAVISHHAWDNSTATCAWSTPVGCYPGCHGLKDPCFEVCDRLNGNLREVHGTPGDM